MMERNQFSDEIHAEIYKLYRPDIPEEIVTTIVSYLKEKFEGALERAVDVGCGSGQSTLVLAPYFREVFGFDSSVAQINEAKKTRTEKNVSFAVCPAETLPLKDNSVQLLTTCAALHWFEKDVFFKEVRRILSNNGVFVACTYHYVKPLTEDPICNDKIDRFFEKKCNELLPYYAPEVVSSLNTYKDISFPFEEVSRVIDYRKIFCGQLKDVVGYFKSLSGFQNMKKKDPEKAKSYISDFCEKLKEIVHLSNLNDEHQLVLYIDFYIILCRKCE